MNTIVSINPGYTTLVFKQTGTKNNDANCFSVISTLRSLDLEATSPKIAEQWVDGLRAYLKYGRILSQESLQKRDLENVRKEELEQKRKVESRKTHEADRAKLKAARERATNQISTSNVNRS